MCAIDALWLPQEPVALHPVSARTHARKPFGHMTLPESIALRLPDLPRWVEARACLLGGECDMFGLEDNPAPSLVLRDRAGDSLFVVGTPAIAAIRAAAQHITEDAYLISPVEQAGRVAEALPDWRRTRAVLHLLPDEWRLPRHSDGEVRFLDPGTLDRSPAIPADLRQELRVAAEHSSIAATYVDGQPVSFCYAGAITESLWDVSIDTLPEFRRRGYAALCVARMVRHMNSLRRQPVWCAAEENPASWRLARKLGFAPVDEIALFAPGARESRLR